MRPLKQNLSLEHFYRTGPAARNLLICKNSDGDGDGDDRCGTNAGPHIFIDATWH